MDELQQILMDGSFMPAQTGVSKSALMTKRNAKATASLANFSKAKRLLNALQQLQDKPIDFLDQEFGDTTKSDERIEIKERAEKGADIPNLKEYLKYRNLDMTGDLKVGNIKKERKEYRAKLRQRRAIKKRLHKHFRELLGDEETQPEASPIPTQSTDSITELKSAK